MDVIIIFQRCRYTLRWAALSDFHTRMVGIRIFLTASIYQNVANAIHNPTGLLAEEQGNLLSPSLPDRWRAEHVYSLLYPRNKPSKIQTSPQTVGLFLEFNNQVWNLLAWSEAFRSKVFRDTGTRFPSSRVAVGCTRFNYDIHTTHEFKMIIAERMHLLIESPSS